MTIPTYIINLQKRKDRRNHIMGQFVDKSEFDTVVFNAIESKKGAEGIWLSMVEIIKKAKIRGLPFVLICEDDHIFTDSYNSPGLIKAIEDAQANSADLLLGGISWGLSPNFLSPNLWWIEDFNGFQFTVIFQEMYHPILNHTFENDEYMEGILSSLSKKILLIHPFISIQKYFGYSDVTDINNDRFDYEDIFRNWNAKVEIFKDIFDHYRDMVHNMSDSTDLTNYTPRAFLYANFEERQSDNGNVDLLNQKTGFDWQITHLDPNEGKATAYSDVLKQIMMEEIALDSELVMLSDEYHQFTDEYSKEALTDIISEAAALGAGLILGGTGNYEHGMPISDRLVWISRFYLSSFLIIFKKSYQAIAELDMNDFKSFEDAISSVVSDKFVMVPFLSISVDYPIYQENKFDNRKVSVTEAFHSCQTRIQNMKDALDFRSNDRQPV